MDEENWGWEEGGGQDELVLPDRIHTAKWVPVFLLIALAIAGCNYGKIERKNLWSQEAQPRWSHPIHFSKK